MQVRAGRGGRPGYLPERCSDPSTASALLVLLVLLVLALIVLLVLLVLFVPLVLVVLALLHALRLAAVSNLLKEIRLWSITCKPNKEIQGEFQSRRSSLVMATIREQPEVHEEDGEGSSEELIPTSSLVGCWCNCCFPLGCSYNRLWTVPLEPDILEVKGWSFIFCVIPIPYYYFQHRVHGTNTFYRSVCRHYKRHREYRTSTSGSMFHGFHRSIKCSCCTSNMPVEER